MNREPLSAAGWICLGTIAALLIAVAKLARTWLPLVLVFLLVREVSYRTLRPGPPAFRASRTDIFIRL